MNTKILVPVVAFHFAWLIALCALPVPVQTSIFRFGSYYVLLALCLASGWAFWQNILAEQMDTKSLLKRLAMPFAIACLTTLFIFVSVTPEWRILSDETNLIATARSFLIDRSAQNITMGKNYYDLFNTIEAGTPTRPLLFPFLIYLTHIFLGFHWQNAFVANALVSLGFFTGLLYWFRSRGGWTLALATLFALLSIPLLTLSISSAGFDFLAAALALGNFALLYRYCQSPSAERLLLLSCTLLLLAHVRYESILALVIILPGLFAFGLVKKEQISRYVWFYFLMPLFLAPIGLQRYLTQGQYENPEGGPPLAVRYLWKFLPKLLHSQFDFHFNYPYATGFFCFSLAVGGYALAQNYFCQNTPQSLAAWQRKWLWLAGICFGALNLIYLAHHFGDASHPSQARFFLLWAMSWALLPALRALHTKCLSPRFLLFAGFASFCVYHPLAMQNDFLKKLTLPRETRYYLEYLERTQPDRRILVVYDRPGQLIAEGFGAVDFTYYRANTATLNSELKNGLYRDIITMQHIKYATGQADPSDALPISVQIEPLQKMQTNESVYLQIAKVKHE